MSDTTASPESGYSQTSRIDAFVGRKSDYYKPIWISFASANSSKVRFNFAAAFFSAVWLLYRKLYLAFSILIIVVIADSAISVYLEESGVVSRAVIAAWDRLSPFVYGGVVGAWANYWYFSKFEKLNRVAMDHSPDPEIQNAFLKKKGGINLAGPGIVFLISIALVYWSFQ